MSELMTEERTRSRVEQDPIPGVVAVQWTASISHVAVNLRIKTHCYERKLEKMDLVSIDIITRDGTQSQES